MRRIVLSGYLAALFLAWPLPAQIGTGSINGAVALNGVTVATFTDNSGDPASDFAATINWGDGTTTSGTVSGASGAF